MSLLKELLPVKNPIQEYMGEYNAELKEASLNDKKKAMGNVYPWQIYDALGTFLDKADRDRKPIEILTGGSILVPEFDFYSSLKKKNVYIPQIRICLPENNLEGYILPELLDLFKSNPRFQIRSFRDDLKEQIREREIKISHFWLVGDLCRYEKEHEDLTTNIWNNAYSPKVPATINFNNPECGKNLKKLFECLWERSSSIF